MFWSYQQFTDPNFPGDQTTVLLHYQSVPEKITLHKAKNGTNSKKEKKKKVMKHPPPHF